MNNLKCPWGCDQLNKRGVCDKCRFKFHWLLECGWMEASSMIYIVKVRNGDTRYLAPSREFKDCYFTLKPTGDVSDFNPQNKPMPDGMKKWNRKHKILKINGKSFGWEIINKKKNKRRSSSHKDREHKREKKMRFEDSPPTPLSLDDVERIENQVEAVDILSFSFL